jgi:Domain of unknown function (DUF1127)
LQAPGLYKAFAQALLVSRQPRCRSSAARTGGYWEYAMSQLFRFPHIYVNHDDFTADNEANANADERSVSEHYYPTENNNRRTPLRDDHIVLWLIDRLLTLHGHFVSWRNRRQTFRALDDLDERQLRDIGLTRDLSDFNILGSHKSYRALAELDDTQLCHLSERGLQVRREVRRAAADRKAC